MLHCKAQIFDYCDMIDISIFHVVISSVNWLVIIKQGGVWVLPWYQQQQVAAEAHFTAEVHLFLWLARALCVCLNVPVIAAAYWPRARCKTDIYSQ